MTRQDRQDRADAVDQEMAVRLLPDAALDALGRWWNANKTRFADGTPGTHTAPYTPSRWAQIMPWPQALAPLSRTGDARVSRAQVASIVADTLRREAFPRGDSRGEHDVPRGGERRDAVRAALEACLEDPQRHRRRSRPRHGRARSGFALCSRCVMTRRTDASKLPRAQLIERTSPLAATPAGAALIYEAEHLLSLLHAVQPSVT
ncbi:hypothetical protein ACF1A5_31400 [Streptomyces sp. NPDC014864]|uniref:hypothetical protein n=1 Tax=Streptomyces sp. NPDC014864 TaxID=3364924 RepID=UPI0036FD827D